MFSSVSNPEVRPVDLVNYGILKTEATLFVIHGSGATVKTLSYRGLKPKSEKATAAARGSSRKRDTRCEILLRRALWRMGLRYRVNVRSLPGNPDIVFRKAKVVVFVDGDFWHGRNLRRRLRQLAEGHNPEYWTRKLRVNVARDRRVTKELQDDSWRVIRVWEGDVRQHTGKTAARIASAVRPRPNGLRRGR